MIYVHQRLLRLILGPVNGKRGHFREETEIDGQAESSIDLPGFMFIFGDRFS